jgi:hypothetical protein
MSSGEMPKRKKSSEMLQQETWRLTTYITNQQHFQDGGDLLDRRLLEETITEAEKAVMEAEFLRIRDAKDAAWTAHINTEEYKKNKAAVDQRDKDRKIQKKQEETRAEEQRVTDLAHAEEQKIADLARMEELSQCRCHERSLMANPTLADRRQAILLCPRCLFFFVEARKYANHAGPPYDLQQARYATNLLARRDEQDWADESIARRDEQDWADESIARRDEQDWADESIADESTAELIEQYIVHFGPVID